MGASDRGETESKCPFCQIIAGKREAKIIYQDETVVVFEDIHPHAPVHLLIVPIKHIRSVNDLTEEDESIVTTMIMRARDVAKEVSIDRSGYKLLLMLKRAQARWSFICTCI
jgi:histidine triad (HIT) family protein